MCRGARSVLSPEDELSLLDILGCVTCGQEHRKGQNVPVVNHTLLLTCNNHSLI